MGWSSLFSRRFEHEQNLPPKHILMQEPGAVYGSVTKNINGSWEKKFAVITAFGCIAIYANEKSGYVYDLRDLDSFKMKFVANGDTEIKFKTAAGNKCALKLDCHNANILADKIVNFEEPSLPIELDGMGIDPTLSVKWLSEVHLSQDLTVRSKFETFLTEKSFSERSAAPRCDSFNSIPSYTGSQFTHSTISVMGNGDFDPIERLADFVF